MSADDRQGGRHAPGSGGASGHRRAAGQLRRARRRAVACAAGDDSFDVYPRKGEFLVFDPPPEAPLERILLPVPTKRTKGVLVFPTVDGR